MSFNSQTNFGKNMKQKQQLAKELFYQNSNYHFERREKKTLVLKWVAPSDKKTINETLYEPLKIDKLCDIYIDTFTTWHSTTVPANNIEDSAFVLKINEFNLQISSNDATIFNSIVIPNDFTGAASASNKKTHKGKKLNYICSINPTNIDKITGTITDLNGDANMFTAGDLFIAEFIFVARD
tara:strand:+ start:144 stop:689 length:546 start_codon:yes stop_codon:yes gene_type:complete